MSSHSLSLSLIFNCRLISSYMYFLGSSFYNNQPFLLSCQVFCYASNKSFFPSSDWRKELMNHLEETISIDHWFIRNLWSIWPIKNVYSEKRVEQNPHQIHLSCIRDGFYWTLVNEWANQILLTVCVCVQAVAFFGIKSKNPTFWKLRGSLRSQKNSEIYKSVRLTTIQWSKGLGLP